MDSRGNVLGFFSEEAPQDLEAIKIGDKETAIMELEMIAISIAARLGKPLIRSRRVVLFTDSEAVRSSLLKSSSSNNVVDCLMSDFFKLEEDVYKLSSVAGRGPRPVQAG